MVIKQSMTDVNVKITDSAGQNGPFSYRIASFFSLRTLVINCYVANGWRHFDLYAFGSRFGATCGLELLMDFC